PRAAGSAGSAHARPAGRTELRARRDRVRGRAPARAVADPDRDLARLPVDGRRGRREAPPRAGRGAGADAGRAGRAGRSAPGRLRRALLGGARGIARRSYGVLHRASPAGRTELRRPPAALPERHAAERGYLREGATGASASPPPDRDAA